MGATINNESSTTESPSKKVTGDGWGTEMQIFDLLDSVVVKTQNCLAMYNHRETI